MNSERQLIKFLNKVKKKRVFILTGKKSFYLSGMDYYLNKYLLKENCFFFFKKEKDPKISELKKIILKIKNYKPEFLIAIGGGSVLDLAKVANCFSNIKNLKRDIIKSKNKFKKNSYLVAIPTTAGTGSEVTPGAVIYINKIKYSIEGKEIKPDKYFLIPSSVVNNSKKLKASSGFDAISQSIESLISRKSNKVSVIFAKKSLKILFKNYISYLQKPSLKNSEKMLMAANFSGRAISISKTTAPHAISYPFTSHFGIPHGEALSLTLNEFLLFNFMNMDKADVKFNLKKRFEILFRISGTKSIKEFTKLISQIKKKARLEDSFKKLRYSPNSTIPKVLSGINIKRLSNNPIKLTTADVKKIIESKFIFR